MRGRFKVCLAIAALVALLPAAAFAQEGQIAGTVRDAQGGVMPGVLVEVTSPQLIQKVRSTTTDTNGQYRLTNLPVGSYDVTFTLEGFTKQQQKNVVLSSGFTAPVNASPSTDSSCAPGMHGATRSTSVSRTYATTRASTPSA